MRDSHRPATTPTTTAQDPNTDTIQEFIARSTKPADWWDAPNEHVLGGRDLERPEQGTWLGITRQGRIACLTNFREPDQGQAVTGLKSRGGIVNSFLQTPPSSTETTAESARRLVEGNAGQNVGGFSLLFGQLRRPSPDGSRPPLAIISNRTPDLQAVTWVAAGPNEVHGLSNSHFGDLTWPKVVHGAQLTRQSVTIHAEKGEATKQQLVDRLFEILSVDMLPRRKPGEQWDSYVLQLRNSIFIPQLGGEVERLRNDEVAAADSKAKVRAVPTAKADENTAKIYGTQKQTVILVDVDGHATFIEKTLACSGAADDSVKAFEFDIEGW